jgi:gluconolactonase
MAHDALDPIFRRLIDEYAPVRQLGTGFTFTEGPIWHPVEQYLLFSDMPADVRRRLDHAGVREVLRPSNKANGLTYDADLNLIVCEHTTSSLVRVRPNGEREIIASHFEGRELNSPNDLCIHSNGAIYFSDPWYGRMPVFGLERARDLGWQGVFRVPPGGGQPQLLVDRYMFSQPNGLCFSPDEKKLYVNDTEQASIRVFDVQADGSLKNGRIFASGISDTLKPGVPDGMKCDTDGNIWVTAPGGLWVYAPDGRHVGKVSIPELAANLHWGGSDWRTLYVCATTSVYAVDVKIGPRNEPFMRAQQAAKRSQPVTSSMKTAATNGDLQLDASRCVLIIQDMQNDVVMDGGAFAASGSPAHCREQNCIANIAKLASAARARGVPVIHVWFVSEAGGSGVTQNAPLFEGLVEANGLVRGTWGVAPVPGLEAMAGDHIVEKNRMSAWEGTRLETLLKSLWRDVVIVTGAWTNMSIEHTARSGADKGYFMVVPENGCSTMNQEWHLAAVNYGLQQVSIVTDVDAVISALK